MYKLITSVKQEKQHISNLCENCVAAPVKTKLLFEAADKLIGNVIAALNAGKNPFEVMPGSRDVLAGLMLLAKETNRDALNLNQKKFDLISQYTSEKESVKKFVAQIAQKHGQSLIRNLEAYVVDRDRRGVLKGKLQRLQSEYSRAKQKVNKGKEVSNVINA